MTNPTEKKRSNITVFGYGSQGRAWARNLRDNGWYVDLRLRPQSPANLQAHFDGFIPSSTTDNTPTQPLVALLVPDQEHASLLQQQLTRIPKNSTVIVAHGYSFTFDTLPLRPDLDLILVAPKIIGKELRNHYLRRQPVTVAVGVARNRSGQGWRLAHQVARAVGGRFTEVVSTTLREETIADLFSEQALLCGALPALTGYVHNLMVERGIHPRLARQECFAELVWLATMLRDHGIEGLDARISALARFGGQRARRILVDQEMRGKIRQIYHDIESGKFAQRFRRVTQEMQAFASEPTAEDTGTEVTL